jgi:hypothetical protein
MKSLGRQSLANELEVIHQEIALAGSSEVRAYLAGSSRDATWNKKHGTTRWAQSDRD